MYTETETSLWLVWTPPVQAYGVNLSLSCSADGTQAAVVHPGSRWHKSLSKLTCMIAGWTPGVYANKLSPWWLVRQALLQFPSDVARQRRLSTMAAGNVRLWESTWDTATFFGNENDITSIIVAKFLFPRREISSADFKGRLTIGMTTSGLQSPEPCSWWAGETQVLHKHKGFSLRVPKRPFYHVIKCLNFII